MSKKIAVFWPGDARDVPNQLALPNVREATARLEQALKKLGRVPYQVEGYLSKPHHAIEKLGTPLVVEGAGPTKWEGVHGWGLSLWGWVMFDV